DLVIDLTLGAGYLVLLGLAWRRLRISYRIYSLAIVALSLGYYTGPFYPYMGLPRHLLLACPVFICIGSVVRRPLPLVVLIVLGSLGMLFLLLQYVIEGWVP